MSITAHYVEYEVKGCFHQWETSIFLVIKPNTQWPKWPWQSLPLSSPSLHTVDAKTLPTCPLASKVFTQHAASDLFQRDNAAKVVNIQSGCLYFNSWEVSTRGSRHVVQSVSSLWSRQRKKVRLDSNPVLIFCSFARSPFGETFNNFCPGHCVSYSLPTVRVLAFNMNSDVSLRSPRLERRQ